MEVPNEWWKSFFSGLAVELWRAVTTEAQTRQEADFIEQELAAPKGARLLDVPCGGGRLAIELAARGYAMTGVEYSDTFAQQARAKVQAGRMNVAIEQRDMRDLPWEQTFDGVFCFGNSFGYLDDTGNVNFLRAVARVMKSGGRFLLESTCTELALRDFQEHGWFKAGEILMLEENEYDLARGRINTEYTFIVGARQERKRGWQRLYALNELRRLIEEAGFAEVKEFGSLDGEPVQLNSGRLYVAATRSR
jgi:SAM-dependent methyltransferase